MIVDSKYRIDVPIMEGMVRLVPGSSANEWILQVKKHANAEYATLAGDLFPTQPKVYSPYWEEAARILNRGTYREIFFSKMFDNWALDN